MNDEFGVFADPQEKLVLIVDDDDGVREFLEVAVRREGFQVVTAANGREAQSRIEEALPSLIVLDLMLPGEGGYEILRRLQQGETAEIPVIVITGRNKDRSETERLLRREANVRDLLTKPIKPVFLATALHRALNTKPRASE